MACPCSLDLRRLGFPISADLEICAGWGRRGCVWSVMILEVLEGVDVRGKVVGELCVNLGDDGLREAAYRGAFLAGMGVAAIRAQCAEVR